jgi:hypothetical protein
LKPARVQALRGFESHPLRQFLRDAAESIKPQKSKGSRAGFTLNPTLNSWVQNAAHCDQPHHRSRFPHVHRPRSGSKGRARHNRQDHASTLDWHQRERAKGERTSDRGGRPNQSRIQETEKQIEHARKLKAAALPEAAVPLPKVLSALAEWKGKEADRWQKSELERMASPQYEALTAVALFKLLGLS